MRKNKRKQSITTQYIRLIGIFAFAFIIGLVVLLGYQKYIHNQYAETNKHLQEKEAAAHQLERTFNQIFFEMRGYLAFDNITMRNKALQLEDDTTELILLLKKAAVTEEDLLFISEVSDFQSYYFEVFIPELLTAYETEANSDKSIAMNIAQQNGTQRVNELQSSMSSYTNAVDSHILENFKKYSLKQTISQWFFVVFLFFMLGMLATFVRFMFKRLGTPLSELAAAAEEISLGRDIVTFPQNDIREDELGTLSRAFEKMIRSIQENEQNLVAQNEELIAQQDELHVQKDELEFALNKIQVNETNLKRRNDLIKSLSTSLNKTDVLQNIVENFSRLLNADHGLIATTDLNIEYAAFGLSDEEIKQYIYHQYSGIIQRLYKTKQAFTIQRKCTPEEKGYHVSELYCYDFYIPVLSADNELVALMTFTRFANTFTKQEIEEYTAISKQISLSLERIRLFEESEFNRLLTQDMINTLHEGVQLVDDKGTILQENTIIQKLFIVNPITMVNESFETWSTKILPSIEDGAALMCFLKTIISDGTPQQSTHTYHITSPVKRVMQVYYEELYRGNKKYGTLFVHRDITKEYEVDQMKSEFVSTVSHELRTPLSSVLGFTELMLNKDLKPERQEKYLLTIYQEAKRLTALINDFLDVQRMESGKQTYEKKFENLLPIIHQVIDMYNENEPDHIFQIQKKTANTTVLGDNDKLIQVFNNLINNAVKYSPAGGEIKVVLYEKEHSLCIDIIDQGLGIPEEALPNLFTKFYRVDNSDRRKIGGTGLGLSIVHEIMKAHEGTVSVTSILRKGSRFTLTFPLVESKATEEKVRNDFQSFSLDDSVHVIVIEDDKNLASLLTTELEDNGFHVLQYMQGDAGMEAIKKYKPDTIVLDIMLDESGINGWEILEQVKHDSDLQDIPIIISSALEEKEKGFKLGASEYLIKPYPPHKLSSTILQTLLIKEKSGQILVPAKTES
ncbi:ATP-binding protein [Niallia oryzisoli]|uniref:ATP-binding protein n=1 Tax=Niallia oryzisoli TaxID=1737571 RepID=UPI003735A284